MALIAFIIYSVTVLGKEYFFPHNSPGSAYVVS